MYHVGRPGEDGFAERFLLAWGVDGHNTPHQHLLVGRPARLRAVGRLRPAVAGLRQRQGDPAALLPPRDRALLQPARAADHGGQGRRQRQGRRASTRGCRTPPRTPTCGWRRGPGSEAAILLAVASHLLRTRQIDRDYLRRWVNWETYLERAAPGRRARLRGVPRPRSIDDYADYTFEFAAAEARVPVEQIRALAEIVADRGHRPVRAHLALGGGRQPRRLAGGALPVLPQRAHRQRRHPGRHQPQRLEQVHPARLRRARGPRPLERAAVAARVPAAHHEMSILLPHFLNEGRGKLDVYFTRVYNPVWTNPDGFTWIEALTDADRVGCHVALTPTWSETAAFADYVLPMGHSTERHDTHSYETHAGRWLGFRQPVRRVAMDKLGHAVQPTPASPTRARCGRRTSSGSSCRGGSTPTARSASGATSSRRTGRARRSPSTSTTAGSSRTACPACPRRPRHKGSRRWTTCASTASSRSPRDVYRQDERPLTDRRARRRRRWTSGGVLRKPTDRRVDAAAGRGGRRRRCAARRRVAGRRMADAEPQARAVLRHDGVVRLARARHARLHPQSHVAHSEIDTEAGEMVLVPTFRLPTLIHTRSGNAKYLNEISNTHPLWVNAGDAERLGIGTGDLVRVTTRIGHFVARVWATQGIRPGVVALSHHMGRWRLHDDDGSRWAQRQGRPRAQPRTASWRMRHAGGVEAVRERRPGQLAGLLGRPGRAPEPHLPGAARPLVGHALLAAAGAAVARPSRATGTATSRSTPRSRVRSTRSGWPRPGPGRTPRAGGARSS